MGYDIYIEGEIVSLRDIEGMMKNLKDASEDVRYFFVRAFGDARPEVGEFMAELRASSGWGQEVAAFIAPHMEGVIKMYGEDNTDWKFVLSKGDYEIVYREDL